MHEIGSGNVKLEVADNRAEVWLNRPEKRNAMNEALLSDLRAALEEVEADDDVRAMVLLGEGPVLSAGMDLEMMRERGEEDSPEMETSLDDVTHFIEGMTTPSVAAIEGAAVAGAFELVLPVDFRIIAEDASYGLLEVTLGVFPSGGGTQRLPRLVGLSKAKEIVLTGDLIDPQEAADCNLVHEVVAPDEVAPTAREWADNLAENAPLGMEAARELLNTALDVPLEQGLELESARGARLVETDDYTEGFTARLEGREPEFEGK